MKQLVLIFGAVYGMLGIILGAFGAHLFKSYLSPEKLLSFDVGVRYQMYHALLLLIIGFALSFESSIERWSAICIIVGVFLFSVSIYLLAFSQYWNLNFRFLGPITPLGGLFMIVGWGLLLLFFFKFKTGITV